jgi:hypothetical protein
MEQRFQMLGRLNQSRSVHTVITTTNGRGHHAARVSDAALMENKMKKAMIALLLSLAVTGCIVAPGYDDRGRGGDGHGERHGEHEGR